MGPLTPRAERILAAAQGHARRREQERVGTEHLLLALVDDSNGVAAQVLSEFVEPQVLRDRINEVLDSPHVLDPLVVCVGRAGRDGPRPIPSADQAP